MRVQRHLDLLGAIATTLVWILSRIKGEGALAFILHAKQNTQSDEVALLYFIHRLCRYMK